MDWIASSHSLLAMTGDLVIASDSEAIQGYENGLDRFVVSLLAMTGDLVIASASEAIQGYENGLDRFVVSLLAMTGDTVIASDSEAIQGYENGLDRFVAFTPRDDGRPRHCEPTGPRDARPDDRLREAIQRRTKHLWIASSLTLPCANASRLSQAMT
jgi:hypothetical protein